MKRTHAANNGYTLTTISHFMMTNNRSLIIPKLIRRIINVMMANITNVNNCDKMPTKLCAKKR